MQRGMKQGRIKICKADAIREELAQKGIEIKDTREGTIWKLVK